MCLIKMVEEARREDKTMWDKLTVTASDLKPLSEKFEKSEKSGSSQCILKDSEMSVPKLKHKLYQSV